MIKKLNSAKRASAMAMAALMAMNVMTMSAYAATNNVTSTENVEVAEDAVTVDDAYTGTTQNTEVEVVRAATFKVTIPKKIVLDGARGAANDADYNVTVVADIPGDEQVTVAPAVSTFEMSEAGGVKANITATVTQADTTWSVADDGMDALAADAGVIKAGNVSVANLSAGEWSGNFDFNISIGEIAGDTP